MSRTLSATEIAALLNKSQAPAGDGAREPETNSGKIWCEFCKGWYYEEFHYGESEVA